MYTEKLLPNVTDDTPPPPPPPPLPRANATLLMLARNTDIAGVELSMQSMEAKFNSKRNYPWTFLNDEPFTDEFMQRASAQTNGSVTFGLVPADHWVQPSWIDEDRARLGREMMANESIPYADSVSYRNMCRFYSGFFFQHELLQQYKWYWRVEPDIKYSCELDYDPFMYMIENDKRYGFTISLTDFELTLQSLWDTIKDFMTAYPEHIAPNNSFRFLTDDAGESYNLCHFWSNFEIADLDFFRSQAYTDYFALLEATGNFYYERWGDAPVHSAAAAILLPHKQVHFFDDIGYVHKPIMFCPASEAFVRGNCECTWWKSYVNQKTGNCLRRFQSIGKPISL